MRKKRCIQLWKDLGGGDMYPLYTNSGAIPVDGRYGAERIHAEAVKAAQYGIRVHNVRAVAYTTHDDIDRIPTYFEWCDNPHYFHDLNP